MLRQTIVFLLSSFLVSTSYAIVPSCEIQGSWTGSWMKDSGYEGVWCMWDVTSEISINKENDNYKFLIQVNTRNGHSNSPYQMCEDSSFILPGQCQNGLLSIDTGTRLMTGRVIDNFMELYDGVDRLSLKRN